MLASRNGRDFDDGAGLAAEAVELLVLGAGGVALLMGPSRGPRGGF